MWLSLVLVFFIVALLAFVVDTKKPKKFPPEKGHEYIWGWARIPTYLLMLNLLLSGVQLLPVAAPTFASIHQKDGLLFLFNILGPLWFPIIGSLLQTWWYRRHFKYVHLACSAASRKWGPVLGLRLGRHLSVLASSPTAIREILSRDEFSGRPKGFFFLMRTFGRRLGLVFCDGPLWQRQRKWTLHHLRHLGLGKKQMEEQVGDEAHQLVVNLQERCVNNCVVVQLHGLFDVSVLNVLWYMIAGERFDLHDAKLRELMDIIHEQFRAVDAAGGLINKLPWLRHVFPKWSGFQQHQVTLQRLFRFLQHAIEQHNNNLSLDCPPRDLIDAFLQHSERTSDADFDREQLLSMCIDLFMAGSETTANTLEFVVLYLLKHKNIQNKVQKELDNIIGKDRLPKLSDRNDLIYLNCVLNEVQRMSHVAPLGIAHRSTQDTYLLGYFIPKDTLLFTNLYALHTDPIVFPDPFEFKPERFLHNSKDLEENFIPFGSGKRRCIGEALARANLFLITASLFQRFNVVQIQGDEPSLEPLDGITLSPKPCQIQLILRN